MTEQVNTAQITASPVVNTIPALKHFYLWVFIIAAVIFGGILLHAKISADAIAKQKVQVIDAATATVTKTQDQVITTSQADINAQNKSLAQQLALIAAAKQQPVSPVDYAKIDSMIASHIQAAPASVVTTTDPTTKEAVTTVPTLDLRNSELACDATTDSLSNCQKVQADLNTQITAQKTEITQLTTAGEQKDKIIAGGTFWQRFGRGVEHGACGAVGAGAGIAVSRGNASGASVLAGGGAYAACEAYIDRKKK